VLNRHRGVAMCGQRAQPGAVGSGVAHRGQAQVVPHQGQGLCAAKLRLLLLLSRAMQ